MSKKKMKTRLGADGYDYPYTSEGLVFDDKGNSIAQKYATKEDLKSLSIVDELEERVSANEESIAWLMENGGGGGGTISCYISTTDAENFIISTGNDLTLHLDFFSPNVGKGTLKVFINDTESMSATLAQGDTATIISGELFAKGNNIMRVYVIDRTGNLTNELKFNVRYGGTQITSTFDPYISYDYGSIVRYYFTVTALDTSDRLTFYMKIDDELQNPISCTSDVRAYFTFPSTLTVGSHYCEAWAEDSVGKSNVLKFNIVILDEQALVVATDTQTLLIEEGSQFSLDYKVYRKGDTSFITKIYIDNELKETGTCGLDMSFYKNSTLLEGQHTIKLEVWDITQKVSDYVVWTVTITPSTYEMVTATVSGSSAIFTAFNKSNSNEGRDKWIGINQDGDEIIANLNNFAFNEESGWIDNNLIFNGNSSVEIPITPLANNAKYGFTLDIEFTSKAIGVEDALVLKLWDDEANCGIKITTEHLILRSKAGNECKLYFTDNENTSAIFIIDRDEGFAKIYINGVMCEAFHLSDYMVNGVAYLEDFTVNDTIKLGGSGYCQIKNLRVYEIALATNEILNNFISNEKNKEKQKNLVNFQKGDDLPTLTIYGDFSGLGKDDKKPCSIVYSSPDITKYGESFTLSHKKSSLQYQGTSSMAYPIKNYRINLRDALGNKWKYNPFNGGQPEARFCLKADFITSNHAHNTGMAKFISDKLYNYDTTDESTMNPMKWWSLQNGGKINDTRETINGFPCRLILVNDGESALNEGQAEPTPGNTKDMGIFNFNNDKDNVASFGFDNEVFPNCISFEVTANSDTSAGAFVPYDNTVTSYKVDFVNWGGGEYKSIKIPVSFFNNKITSYSGGNYIWLINSSGTETSMLNPQNNLPIDLSNYTHIRLFYYGNDNNVINGKTIVKGNDVGSQNATTNAIIGTPIADADTTELEYLQNSFELRYPDADDVGEDYGYLGIPVNTKVVDVIKQNNIYLTSLIETAQFGGELNIDNVKGSRYAMYIYFYGANGYSGLSLSSWYDWVQTTGATVPIPSEAVYVAMQFVDDTDHIIVNGETYYKGNLITGSVEKEPYLKNVLNTDYGLKRVIDWVGNCTDEEFVADFEKYFNKHYTLRYFLFVTLIGAVDNLGKNMMFDTFDGQIWYPRFYDIDTILSYDNSGEIKFDVDIEMEQGYWNTSSSRLWTRVRDLFHDELIEVYKDMRGNGVTYEGIMKYMYDEQIAKIPQTYYNKDFDIKYAPYADTYIGKAHGDGYQHMKRWLKNRFIFCDTLFDYEPSYNNDVLTIRANTTDLMSITIETYTPLYQHVSYYNGQMSKEKVTPGQPITFEGYAQTATDQEVLIYGGSNIKKITGISSCNPNSMLIGGATRLTELDISNCPILTIVNSNKANFSPHTYLNKLDISNCPQLGGTLNISNSPLLQEANALGSAVDNILFPTSVRNLETLRVPKTVTSLTLNDAGLLYTIEMEEGNNLQSIALTNCNNLTETINFDLTQTPTVLLDNSFNGEELYMSATTNLTLKNMPSLQRVIFTPNSEYSAFDINNVLNGANYKITTFNNPMMTDFITTAPYRLSYKNDSTVSNEQEDTIPVDQLEGVKQLESVYFDSTAYVDLGFKPTSSMKIELDVKMEFNKQYGHWLGSDETNKIQWGQSATSSLHTSTWSITPTSNLTTRQTYTISCTTGGNANLYLFCGYYNGNVESEYCGKGTLYNCKIYDKEKLIHNYIPCDMLGEAYLYDAIEKEIVYATGKLIGGERIVIKKYGDITPNTAFTANTLDLADTQFQNVKFLCTTDVYNLKVPTTMKNFYCDSAFDIDTDVIEDASYEVIHEELIEPYTTNYEGEVVRYTNHYWKDYPQYHTDLWIHGKTISEGVISDSSEARASITNYLPCSPNLECSITYSQNYGVKMTFFDKNKIYISEHGASRTVTTISPNNTAYVVFNIPYYHLETEISYKAGVVPNIIPSSANGSLIFNMYSNNTTQPTSTSPYMWDLTGLKLEDFYTYGMNNWVKASEDSYININNTIMYKIPKWRYDGTTIYQGWTTGGNIISTSPILLDDDTTKMTVTTSNGCGYYAYGSTDWDGTIATKQSFPGGTTGSGATINISHTALLRFFTFHSLDIEWFDITTIGNQTKTVRYYLADMIEVGANDELRKTINAILYNSTLSEIKSITMPQRMPGYSVRLVNADITPDEYPTMLYPKLIDTTLPITGKLDYTAYNGSSLAWAYAYTTGDVSINPLDSRNQGNITQDYNKLYGTDFVDIVDVWVYKDTDTSKLSTNEAITKAYIELTNDNYQTRIDEVIQWYPNCNDIYLFDDGSVTSLYEMLKTNPGTVRATQIKKITFMENYFENLTSLARAFINCRALTEVNNIPNSVKEMNYTFEWCSGLKNPPILPNNLTNMYYTFATSSLTTPPVIPDSVNNMVATFDSCTSLTQAPTIPQGVTNMQSTFQGCTALTTVPNIPSSCEYYDKTFYNCTKLSSVPIDGWKGYFYRTFYKCSSLNQQINIESATLLDSVFEDCSSLTTPPILPSNYTGSMENCFQGCTSLTQAPVIPDGVTNMGTCFNGCKSLKQGPVLPESVIQMHQIYATAGVTDVYIPLTNVSTYDYALNNTGGITNVTWVGERKSSYNVKSLAGNASIPKTDIQELVPEHLADLYKDKAIFDFSKKEITINNTKTTLE